jgi:hypothetical protein
MVDLEKVFKALVTKYPRLKIIWRNTVVGHAHCTESMAAPPLTEPPNTQLSDPTFHWNIFGTQNRNVRDLIDRKFPQVRF